MPGSFSSNPFRSSPPSLNHYHPYSRHRRPSRSSSSNVSSNHSPRRKFIPATYKPSMPINDEDYATDPHPVACRHYMEQALQLWERKQLTTFDRASESYVRWNCGFLGLVKLNIAIKTNQLVEPAFCHHILNEQRHPSWCKLEVVWRHPEDPNLEVIGYMTPLSHICIAHPIYKAHLRRQGHQPLMAEYIHDDDDDDDDDDDEDNLALERSYSAVLRPRPRMISASNVDATTEDADAEVDHTALLALNPDLVIADNNATFDTDQFIYKHPDINYLSTDSHTQDSTTLTQQRNLWNQLSSTSAPRTPTKRKSLYPKKEAEVRKLTDAPLTRSILDAAEEGQYQDSPTAHPSFDVQELDSTPLCLRAFHLPGAASLAFGRSGHSQNSQIGTALTQLNGAVGISLLEFCEVRKRTIKCLSCLCYFSPDGYQRHVEYTMVCQGTPAMEPAPDLTGIFDAIPFQVERRFPSNAVRFNNSSATNPIGLAWLMWNSPGGVTHDVWVQLITAWRRCSGGCDRVRTFKAHLDHLLEDPCAAFGDEAVGVFPPDTDEGNAA